MKPEVSESGGPAIVVDVLATWLPEHSDALKKKWVFSYTVTITNQSECAVTLIARLWRITHVNQTQSKVEHVRGTGVVGYQPTLHPGKSFSYTSGAILSTPSGIMDGEYLMMRPNGTQFQALIPPFLLAIPSCVH